MPPEADLKKVGPIRRLHLSHRIARQAASQDARSTKVSCNWAGLNGIDQRNIMWDASRALSVAAPLRMPITSATHNKEA